MTDRPTDLPDFKAPPVTEVVLGVQFNTLEGFLSPHLGLIWDAYRTNFPKIEEHPSLNPTFETFGPNPDVAGALQLRLVTTADMPRVYFLNHNRTQLLQVQRDRFLHNWRKIGEGDNYPRFERMIETFQNGLTTLQRVLARQGLGPIVPNQCEVSYINQILLEEDKNVASFDRVFSGFSGSLSVEPLGMPEDGRFLFRYVIRRNGNPVGRLLIAADPGRRQDGQRIIQLSLTARGVPQTTDFDGVVDFLNDGRRHIVRAFTQVTSAEMHKKWGRIQ